MRAGAMASLAGDAQIRGFGIELIFCGGGGGVAAEAETRFVGRDGATGGVFESRGYGMGLAGSDIERLSCVVKANVAFIKLGVLLVDEGLSHVA